MAKQQRSSTERSGRQSRTRPDGTGQLSRGQQRRRATQQRARRPWWRGPAPLIGTVVVVLALIVVFIVVANQPSPANASIGQPVSPALVKQVTDVSPSVIAAVGAGKLPDGSALPSSYHAIAGKPLSNNGLPEVLYVGADFCPHCAADRWSLLNAFSRFGTFSGLTYMRSAVTDGDLATVTFHGSHYTSRYVSFVTVENADRNGNQLEALTAEQQQLFTNPSLGNSGYPFLYFDGQYANDAPNSYPGGYDESVLTGKSWSQIAGALSNPNDPITQGVIGNANYITAIVCKLTHNQPASACGVGAIKSIQQQLPTKP